MASTIQQKKANQTKKEKIIINLPSFPKTQVQTEGAGANKSNSILANLNKFAF